MREASDTNRDVLVRGIGDRDRKEREGGEDREHVLEREEAMRVMRESEYVRGFMKGEREERQRRKN